ncbi:hypothetical protein [Rathayibacter oskolensis]|nr:hypothetical protein [Rathayibacter oskolensis]
MRSRRRTERRSRARRLLPRAPLVVMAALVAGTLVACTPAVDRAEPSPTVRVTAVEVAASAEFVAAKEKGLAIRDEALALLTATDGSVEGASRADLIAALSALNTALGGVSADAITSATLATSDAEVALADRVLGLAEATLASGGGSSARRAALTAAIAQLESARDGLSGLGAAAQAVLDAREPLVPPPGSGGAPPPRQTAPAPAPPPAAPTTAPPAEPEAPATPQPVPQPTAPPQPTTAPEPEPEPQPEPEPTLEPEPDCSTDPALCAPAPTPSIDDPVT